MQKLSMRKRKSTLMWKFTSFVFFILLFTLLVTGLLFFFFYQWGLLPFRFERPMLILPLLGLLLASIILGTIFSAFFCNRPLAPVRKMIEAINALGRGQFDTRVEFDGPVEFVELSKSFNHMAKELGSLEIMRKDFISNVAHEFKTPLAVIQGYAELLAGDTLTEAERKEYAQIVRRETERLKDLSTNILKLTKMESQKPQEDPVRFSLDEQVRQVIVFLSPRWEEKQLEFMVDLPETAYVGYADMLSQVWFNLLDNAIKFSPAGGRIRVSLWQDGSWLRLRIQDDGPGMSEEVQARIFEQFYQGEHSHAAEGNGLGLPIVQKIVALHHGEIDVQSQPQAGSVFTVSLPLDSAL